MRSYFRIALLISAAAVQAASPPKVVNDGHGDYVYVPAGAFQMGDNFGDGESREQPVHTVELDAYYIGKYEVTNAEWKRFRDDPRYDDTKFWPEGRVAPKDQVSYWTDARNHGGGTTNSDNYPLIGVNWDSAVAYCNWLSAKTGKKYRLPTEAEWEKAARGTDKRRYPWGMTSITVMPTTSAVQNLIPCQRLAILTAPGEASCKRTAMPLLTERSIWQAM